MQFRTYDVRGIAFPYLEGIGFLTGRSCCRLSLGPDTQHGRHKAHTMHEIAERIQAFIPQRHPEDIRPDMCRWAAITGKSDEADNELLLILRHTLGLQVYLETDARTSPMDANGRLPVWDHVCVRTHDGDIPFAEAMLFHSVLWDGAFDIDAIKKLDAYLNKLGFNGDRYIKWPKRSLPPVGFRYLWRDWRLTSSAVIAPRN